MDKASYFIKNRAMFGSYPTQTSVNELEDVGVRYFINLTHAHESKILPYETKYTYISYPITDRHTPDNHQTFTYFILRISDIILTLPKNDLLYLHCKGGHGRSGVVVSVLLCHIFSLDPRDALNYTTVYHSKRAVMRDRWRKIGSPQTYEQKKFVYNFCKKIYFHRAFKNGHTGGFSHFTQHPVTITNFGTFPTSEAAIQAYKCPDDEEYVEKQRRAKTPYASTYMGDRVQVRDDWADIYDNLVFNVLKLKFDQHPDIKRNLLRTKLNPIIHSKKNWLGKNVGTYLTKLREYYYRQDMASSS